MRQEIGERQFRRSLEAPEILEEEEVESRFRDFGESVTSSLSFSLSRALAGDPFNSIGDIVLSSLTSAIIQPLLQQGFSSLFGGLFGGIFSFHEGGVVPGRPGQEVPAVLEAGEVVIPRNQVGSIGRPGFTIVQNVTGNVDDATLRALRANAEQTAAIVRTAELEAIG